MRRCTRVRSSVKGNTGRDDVADCPAGFAVISSDLRVPGVLRIGLYNGVFPESAVGGGFNLDSGRSIANVLTIDFDLSTGGLRRDEDLLSGSGSLRLRRTARAGERKSDDGGCQNSVEERWEPMHGIEAYQRGEGGNSGLKSI